MRTDCTDKDIAVVALVSVSSLICQSLCELLGSKHRSQLTCKGPSAVVIIITTCDQRVICGPHAVEDSTTSRKASPGTVAPDSAMTSWPGVVHVLKSCVNCLTLTCLPSIFLTLTCLTWGLTSGVVLSSQVWTGVKERVVGCEDKQPGISVVNCLELCGRFSPCTRVAFLPPALTCCLLPVSAEAGASGSDLMVYLREDGVCPYSAAPAIPLSTSVTWRNRLTSLDGYVTCVPDYIWSTNDVSVRCSANEVWTVNGECLRHRWPQAAGLTTFSIPRPVSAGWKMCAHGTPVASAKQLSANIFTASNDRVLNVGFLFATRPGGAGNYSILTFSHVNGQYLNGRRINPPVFPMTETVPFFMEIRATSDFDLDVLVNGAVVCSHTSPISVSTANRVVWYSNVTLQDMDTWCA